MLKTPSDQRQSAEAEKAPASPNPVAAAAASPDQDRPIADTPASLFAAQAAIAGGGGRYALFEPAATAPLIERTGAQSSSGLLDPESEASRTPASDRATLTAGHQTAQVTGDAADYWAPSPGGLLDALSGSLDPRPANLSAMTTADLRDQPAHVQAFLQPLLAPAQAASQKTGVPAELILAQAALETGWGRHQIRTDDGRNSHNLFGIKAGSHWQGPTAAVTTHEYYNGQRTRIRDQFRVYDSYEAAFTDYGRLISRSPRYAAVGTAPTAEQAARALQAGGYATDPAYADKLIKIMGHLDAVVTEAKRSPLIQGF
ncbi:flagellar assembly peptidoglycan hydrolase FlgJ [Halochromatium roseum]|nr:flagellar assembly peptidoglycan hydrolase FlgJ [Halochromatium roseum]